MKMKKVNPIYRSMFVVEFESNELSSKERNLLTEQVINISYDIEHNRAYISFSLNEIKGKIQPLWILEKINDDFNIEIQLHNKLGIILQKVKLIDCTIKSISGIENLDYRDDGIMELNVELVCSNIKRKLWSL